MNTTSAEDMNETVQRILELRTQKARLKLAHRAALAPLEREMGELLAHLSQLTAATTAE